MYLVAFFFASLGVLLANNIRANPNHAFWISLTILGFVFGYFIYWIIKRFNNKEKIRLTPSVILGILLITAFFIF